MKTILLVIVALAFTTQTRAQTFVAESTLPRVTSDGFYRVILSPDLAPYLNASLSNLRIKDKTERDVPFLLQQEQRAYHTTVFKKYKIVSHEQVPNCCTRLVLENPLGTPINNISLSIRNAETRKTARLTGSDDGTSWYALKDDFMLESVNDQQSTSTVRIVDFPLSNYAYYKIEINDSTSAPLNIAEAGYYEVMSEDGKFAMIPNKVSLHDSAEVKATFIHVTFDTIRIVDKIELDLTGSPYFLRAASILPMESLSKREKNHRVYPLSSFTVSSKQPAVVDLRGTRLDGFVIRIENDDNPPLSIASVQTFQLNRYATAWLKANEVYVLRFGPQAMAAPSYDLGNFTDNIPSQIPLIHPGRVSVTPNPSTGNEPTFFTTTIFIWVAIAVVLSALGFMAVRMVKETNARQS